MDIPLVPITLRDAAATDIDAMKELIFTEGPNQWNYLPPDDVNRHMERIAGGGTFGVLALEGEKIVGLGTFLVGALSSLPLGAGFVAVHAGDMVAGRAVGYVAEVVVHSAYGGRGIGSRLLEEVKEKLRLLGVAAIYLKRHEENLRSAAIVRKAGFKEVALFDDPAVRISGSRRTSVSRFEFRVKNGVPATVSEEERISP